MVDHEIFSVREIQVKAGEKVGGSEIVETAGLSQGVSIWRVDPQAIEKKIARHPWVKQVLVRREFPRRVVIEVEEREPKAIAALGKLYYVDRDGYIFKPSSRASAAIIRCSPGSRRRIYNIPRRTRRAAHPGRAQAERCHRQGAVRAVRDPLSAARRSRRLSGRLPPRAHDGLGQLGGQDQAAPPRDGVVERQ
jgi:hypothetical protein